MDYIGYLASLAMGITLGLMGGGGSILTVPILVYLFSISPMLATGYSLFVVGTTALFGSFVYLRKGEIDFHAGLGFAVPSVIGVNISRGVILPWIPDSLAHINGVVLNKEILVMLTFAIIMVAASMSMIFNKIDRKPMLGQPLKRMMFIVLQGLGVGLIAGFVGAGGGFLIIPTLVFLAGLTMRVAVGTSLMIIAFQSLLGFAGDVSRGLLIDWTLLAYVVSFAVVGIMAGSLVAHRINEKKLKVAFGWFVLAMGVAILLQQIIQLSSKQGEIL